jgi:RNA polymerase-associated protein
MLVTTRGGVMTLFSAPDEPQSHRTRLVVAEKGIELDVINVVPGKYPSDLLELNPYNSLPTLLDRELVLYDARVVIDYLDERFPHPPLMPVDPVMRAQYRLALYRVERDWYGRAGQIERCTDPKQQAQLKQELGEVIMQSADLFKIKPFFLGDEFSILDATILPILWRLKRYGISVPTESQAMTRYIATMTARPAFRASLTDTEVAMGRDSTVNRDSAGSRA